MISSEKSVKKSVIEGVQSFSYHLSEQPLVFDEPHYVRLVQLSTPANVSFIVTCDFVATSPTWGPFPGYLGIATTRNNNNTWIPLASNSVPALGFLHIQSTTSNTAIKDLRSVTVVLEFAPESWLKHGGGSTIGSS